MYRLFRRAAKGIYYRPLPALLGRSATIKGSESLNHRVAKELVSDLPVKLLPAQSTPLVLAKYGFFPLAFEWLEKPDWTPADRGGVPLLESLGFVSRNPEDQCQPDDPFFSDDPTCLQELVEEYESETVYLLLFLEERPEQALTERLKNKLRSGLELTEFPPDYFPRPCEVTDACLTNAKFAWFHKHFYM